MQTRERNVQQRPQDEGERSAPFVVPPVDVFENESGITLLADLPGVPRERLGVRVDGDSLFIEATAASSGPDNMELVYGEAQIPSYRRQFTLSRELDASRIEAALKDGVLRLTIPKLEEARPRRIEVRVG
ncbi:Hsp20/alpha crystallin family protein [Ramlibacter sp. RBP-2]|uniref:Hsp20/alpha crystallin family protein n=1 Tax=Ramlibacter lithotrophicus TaxID=2606681 RepID=A0A7X6DEV3_9BURK|nr:Hsp20/alpha crystallin family protein [Ramlibacter lithotrophicus]